MTHSFRLYHYWRSSSSWRVRWAMALKSIPCEFVAVSLLNDETEVPSHLNRNPMGYVPVLELINSSSPIKFLCESVAIIEWFEETHPTPSVYPADPILRARCRHLAELVNSGIQPLQNPNVSAYHSSDKTERQNWDRYWILKGFESYETLVTETTGTFSIGDTISLADLFLVPQVYNALRREISLDPFPNVSRIYQSALQTPACKKSSPDEFTPPRS